MDKILEVKNLKISFRTQSGTLKAVRNISFDLERGETLAIVGESGSGKSVTSKAILGILAGNSIVEGGEILYDGKDLLTIDEEEMHKIRGDKISMIFQNPLSSLNPIVKIGKQITEAMLLKNKAARKISRKEFNEMLANLEKDMILAKGAEYTEKIKVAINEFNKFNMVAIKLQTPYSEAHTKAQELLGDIEEVTFAVGKNLKVNYKDKFSDIAKGLPKVINPFLTAGYDEEIKNLCVSLKKAIKTREFKTGEYGEAVALAKQIGDLLKDITTADQPDFFRIGYYELKNPGSTFDGMSIADVNQKCLEYLDDNFMKEFIVLAKSALEFSAARSVECKKEILKVLPSAQQLFAEHGFTAKAAKEELKKLKKAVVASIDPLSYVKDSATYTFSTTIDTAVSKYFKAMKNNPKEEKRFARQSAKREALIAKGKTVDWKVVPKSVIDLDEQKATILRVLESLKEKSEKDILTVPAVDYEAKAIGLIDYFKEKASLVVFKLTKRVAKERAIRIMEEVGIPDSRVRFNQYPFEFSGGMRQRIVIAIALSANPDILICDEPTTALDVTIQAQILELINDLKKKRNLSVIFITHDLGVVANMADKIAVMYAGKIVEYGSVDDIFYDPRHPYTWALLSSMPDLETKEKLDAIPGTPPNMIYPPVGDAFADRNKYAMQIDFEQQPPEFPISDTHWAATWLLHPDAPKVEIPRVITERIERMKKMGGAENG